MKLPHKLLPALFQPGGDIVYFTQDKFGRILVIDNGDFRILSFDSMFEQSRLRLGNPTEVAHKYIGVMLLVLAYSRPQHVTLLGLGGGSLLRTLHHVLPECLFSIIELRATVVRVAQEYFHIPVDDRVAITVDSGLDGIRDMASQSSDIIFSDMFDAYDMAHEQTQKTFLSHCSRVLNPHGWLVINLHSLPNEKTGFFDHLKEHFPTVMMSSNSGNIIVFASKRPPEENKLDNNHIDTMEYSISQLITPLLPTLQLMSW